MCSAAARTALSLLLVVGCSGANQQSPNGASIASSVNAVFASYLHASTLPAFTDKVNALRASSWSSAYQTNLDATNNAPFIIGNHEFAGLHNSVIGAKASFDTLQSTYGNVDSLWRRHDFDARGAASVAQFEDGLNLLEREVGAMSGKQPLKLSADDVLLSLRTQVVLQSLSLQAHAKTDLALDGPQGGGNTDVVIPNGVLCGPDTHDIPTSKDYYCIGYIQGTGKVVNSVTSSDGTPHKTVCGAATDGTSGDAGAVSTRCIWVNQIIPSAGVPQGSASGMGPRGP